MPLKSVAIALMPIIFCATLYLMRWCVCVYLLKRKPFENLLFFISMRHKLSVVKWLIEDDAR